MFEELLIQKTANPPVPWVLSNTHTKFEADRLSGCWEIQKYRQTDNHNIFSIIHNMSLAALVYKASFEHYLHFILWDHNDQMIDSALGSILDIVELIPVVTALHPTALNLIVHVGRNTTRFSQSTRFQQDFETHFIWLYSNSEDGLWRF